MNAIPPHPASDFRQPVIVYRDRIGVPSEIAFTRRQYLGFQRLRPVWTGRTILPGASQLGYCCLRIGGVRGLLFRHAGLAPPLNFSGFVPVVHAQFARGGALALPLARAMGARMVVTLHGGDVGKDKNWRGTLLARRWPAVIGATHRFVCVSHAVADTAIRRGVPAALLTVLPIGVEPPEAPPSPPMRTNFLFAGRFVEKKGIAVLADAMRRLRALGGAAGLICAGDGPLRPVLETLARDIPGVTLAGWLGQDALAAAMDAALALVVPSIVAANGDAEGLPSVVLEAMARGRAVIGSAEGGIAEAVVDGETGFLVAPGDAAALAAAMLRLETDLDLAGRLGAAAAGLARTRFDAVRQSQVLEAILLDAAGLG